MTAVTETTTERRVRATRRGRLETRLGLPPRPKKTIYNPETSWMKQAACAAPDVPEHDRLAFTTVERQADAWGLVKKYCATCPVAHACLTDARAVHSSSLAGGYVLTAGHLAPDRNGDPFRDPEAWTLPAIPDGEVPAILDGEAPRRRGQRWQPRRRSRKARRRWHAA